MLGRGTDSALTFLTYYNTWRDIDSTIRHGKASPERALHAATQANAKILGIEKITGSLEVVKSPRELAGKMVPVGWDYLVRAQVGQVRWGHWVPRVPLVRVERVENPAAGSPGTGQVLGAVVQWTDAGSWGSFFSMVDVLGNYEDETFMRNLLAKN